nr:B157 [uncultured bacterium]ART41072.1 L561 [uncultured bacterium]
MVFYIVLDSRDAIDLAIKERCFMAVDKLDIRKWGIKMARWCEPEEWVRAIRIVAPT